MFKFQCRNVIVNRRLRKVFTKCFVKNVYDLKKMTMCMTMVLEPSQANTGGK